MSYSFNIQLTFLLLVGSTSLFGQNPPDVQPAAKPAPANLKIDGDLSEWGGMAAYNKRVVLYYTIANDAENLYLALKSDNTLITSKILAGGFALSISPAEKNQKDAITVTYPFIEDDEKHNAMMKFAMKGLRSDDVKMSPEQRKEAEAARKAGTVAINRQILNLFKFIKIKGIKAIPDKVIPIYNDAGIKVAAKIDSRGHYLYEMAVPLKYLNIPADAPSIKYNVMLLAKYWPSTLQRPSGNIVTHDGGPPLGEGGVDVRSMSVDTDFWAEYILAK